MLNTPSIVPYFEANVKSILVNLVPQ